MTSTPTSSITDSTGDPTIADSLKNDGVSTVWADTIPAGTRADVTLQGKRYALAIQQDNSTIISVDGRWGSLQGNVVLYLRRPQGQDVNFAVITSASALNAANVFDDSQLAAEVNSHLSGASANLCVFREWPGVEEATIAQITAALPDAASALLLIKDVGTALHATPTAKQTGVGLCVKVNLHEWDSAPSDSLLRRLTDIGQVAGSTPITSLTLGCLVAKGVAPAGQSLTSVVFTSAINVLPVFDSAVLKDISLSLAIARHEPASPLDATLTLDGDLVLATFDPQNPWVSKGSLVIDKASKTAELTIQPAPSQTQAMAQLGAIKLGNIFLHVKYIFGKTPIDLQASLTADITVGNNVVHGDVVFKGIHPSVLLFTVAQTLDVANLLRSVLGSKSPDNLPEFSFTDLAFSYSWEHTSVVVQEGKPAIDPGLTASARADLFGIKFDAHLAFATASNKKKAIYASGRLLGPINLIIISIYGVNNPKSGLVVEYEAQESNAKHLKIDCGISVLDQHFADVHIQYGKSVKDKQPCLHVDLLLKSPAFPGGSATLDLELVKIDGRTHIRLNGIPITEIKDAFDAKKLFDKIRDLTNKDPCKAIDIPLDDALTNSWAPKIEFSKDQPKPEAGKPLQCSFDVSCAWTLTLLKEKKVVVEMKPFPLVMDVPQTWEELPKEIAKAIVNSIDQIVQDLLDNVDKFSEILSFYAAKYFTEKWMQNALRAWLCRHNDAPVPKPLPEPVTVPPKHDNPTDPGHPVVVVPPIQTGQPTKIPEPVKPPVTENPGPAPEPVKPPVPEGPTLPEEVLPFLEEAGEILPFFLI